LLIAVALPVVVFSLCRADSALAAGSPDGSAAVASAEDSLAVPSSSWFVLPNVFYSPETGFGGGFVTGYFFGAAEGSPPSGVQAVFATTERKQFLAELYPELYIAGGDWRTRLEVSSKDYPDVFYGVGPGVPEEAEESYRSRSLGIVLVVSRRLGESVRVGLRSRYLREEIHDTEAGLMLDSGEVLGSEGGTLVGIGPVATWDTRDNIFYATSGFFAEVYSLLYGKSVGSDYGCSRVALDVRRYIPVAGSHSLALHGYFETISGDVPFFALPRLGGSRHMRGYRSGRFLGESFATAQAEYRFPLFWRIRGTAFACLGDVAGESGWTGLEDVEWSVGLGVRYRLSSEGTNVRADYAIGREGGAIYLTVGEAF
jgi:outer membrane protein assembly factor BamA